MTVCISVCWDRATPGTCHVRVAAQTPKYEETTPDTEKRKAVSTDRDVRIEEPDVVAAQFLRNNKFPSGIACSCIEKEQASEAGARENRRRDLRSEGVDPDT